MENDMASKQSNAPFKRSNVSRVAILISIILFVIGLVIYVSSAGQVEPDGTRIQQEAALVPPASSTPKATRAEGQVIVKFKQGVTNAQIIERLTPLNASIKSKIDGIGTTVITVPPGKEDEILKELSTDTLVQYAEPDYIYYLQFTPNDPELAKQWTIVNTGQAINNKKGTVDVDLDLDAAWDVSRGTGVKVAVLDSGLDTTHPEFAGKVAASKSFTSTSVLDTHGHGTHVAGIVAANTNNGQGVAGVCPDCQLLIGKIVVEGSTTGAVMSSAVAPSITWAADSGAQVINMSISGSAASQAIQDAINYAWSKNAVIVVATGNNGSSAKNYPAAFDNVVSVANTTNTDAKSSNSNYGTWVTVAAPGTDIYSTVPSTSSVIGGDEILNYGLLSGTSMASPAVAGVAALIWKTQYGTNNAAVVQRLITTAEKIPGTGTYWINGRINAAAAVGASTNPSASPSTEPEPSTNPGPSSVVPTFVCGGSTNSICPIPSVSGAVNPSGSTNNPLPSSSTSQPSSVPTPSGTVDPTQPCPSSSATVAHRGKSKHKKKKQGGVNRFVNWILKFFIELINLILKLIGGGQLPVPTDPNPTPCNPSEVPNPEPSVTPSIAQPSGVVTPSFSPSPSQSITPSATISATISY